MHAHYYIPTSLGSIHLNIRSMWICLFGASFVGSSFLPLGGSSDRRLGSARTCYYIPPFQSFRYLCFDTVPYLVYVVMTPSPMPIFSLVFFRLREPFLPLYNDCRRPGLGFAANKWGSGRDVFSPIPASIFTARMANDVLVAAPRADMYRVYAVFIPQPQTSSSRLCNCTSRPLLPPEKDSTSRYLQMVYIVQSIRATCS